MLDEFPALGRLEFFESALAFMGGYGVRAVLIAQSLNQIEKAYGPNNAILDNCHVRIAYATNDERTARRISEAIGTTTELRAQRNFTGHRLAPWLPQMMVSRQETQRALITPGEVMQLPADDELVMVAGTPPVRGQKLRYYSDANFACRVLPSAAVEWEERPSQEVWTEIISLGSDLAMMGHVGDEEFSFPEDVSSGLSVAKERVASDRAGPAPESLNTKSHTDPFRTRGAAAQLDEGPPTIDWLPEI
jgi:type IV secretory pathway TraG/TraD family ATPase VirD4